MWLDIILRSKIPSLMEKGIMDDILIAQEIMKCVEKENKVLSIC